MEYIMKKSNQMDFFRLFLPFCFSSSLASFSSEIASAKRASSSITLHLKISFSYKD